ncbi:MAG: apolipoprotein N-acyltransferase [Deltaproteobacteria bacterium]|nr:apolipoprotein N-acyltransferase [Deltaproteobacteria bacterium]
MPDIKELGGILVNILLVCLSALLFAAAFPKFSLSYCAFFCMIPFFAAIELSGGPAGRLLTAAAWTVAHIAFTANWLFVALITHYGVSLSTSLLFVGLFVFVPLFVLYSCFVFAYRLLKTDSLFFYAIIVPGLWVLVEFTKSRFSFLIPWIDIGYAALPFSHFVQVADIAGVYGVSFILVMINAVLWRFILCGHCAVWRKQVPLPGPWIRANAACILILIAALIVPSAYGIFRLNVLNKYGKARNVEHNEIRACVVQGSFSMTDRWSGMGFEHRLKTYLELSAGKAGKGEKRLVVWPETVLNVSTMINDDLFKQLMKWFGKDSLLVSGGVSEEGRAVYNSAYLISGQGRLLRYDKHMLLPYAEAVPPIDLLGRYYSAPEHYSPGRTSLAISAPEATVGVSICLEMLYPGFIRRSTAEGAQFLVNISNDSWFGDTSMPYIHFSAARMRAIENRRYVVRAANSGISGIIAPSGHVMASIPLYLRKSAEADIQLRDGKSLYVRFGDWFILLLGFIIAILSVRTVIRS